MSAAAAAAAASRVVKAAQHKAFTEAVGSGKAVACFSAVWCGPCQRIAPAFEKLSAAPELSKVSFVKVDVDENPESAADVRAVPTFKLFKGGVAVKEFSGGDAKKLQETLVAFARE